MPPGGAPPGMEGGMPPGGPQFDPNTGLMVDPSTGMIIDPSTGMLIDPNTGMTIDPNTGQPIGPTGPGGAPPQGATGAAPGATGPPAVQITIDNLKTLVEAAVKDALRSALPKELSAIVKNVSEQQDNMFQTLREDGETKKEDGMKPLAEAVNRNNELLEELLGQLTGGGVQ